MNNEEFTHLAIMAVVFYVGYRWGLSKASSSQASTAPMDGTNWLETLSGSWAR